LNRSGPYIWFDIAANAFLQHMVRNIAGALIDVGCGKRDLAWFRSLFELKDRTKGGITAKASGLYLTGVDYPIQYNLPSRRATISFWK
jgi:tRNA pseudouridine38-40 synthase